MKRLTVALFLLPLSMAGCGRPGMVPVSGTVHYEDGAPFSGGSISFEAVDGSASAAGAITPDGAFQLTMHRRGDGVPPGRYRAAIVPPLPRAPEPGQADALPLDPKYSSFDTSGLEFTVGTGRDENRFKITVERYGGL